MKKLLPREVLLKAFDAFVGEYDLEKVFKCDEYSELKLRTIAFGLKELAAVMGETIETEVDIKENHIIVKKNSIGFYIIENSQHMDLKRTGFEIVCHYGCILKAMRELGQSNKTEKRIIQTAFAV